MAGGSKKAVYAALFGNLAIAITKFIAAIMTGSASMYAEAYHSASDTFNQVLLLIGIKRSSKAPTERHQFGYGKEAFFWSFIVATMLFGVSGVLSMEHGFSSLFGEPHRIENANISYIVLMVAFAFEANALRIAYKLFKQTIEARGEKVSFATLMTEFSESKDPTILTVMVEDSAALLGIVIAGIGIFLSDITGNSVFDALASLAIGVILMAFAFFLARENRGLLVGESISANEYARVREKIEQEVQEVRQVTDMRTMHLGTEDVVVGIEVNLVDNLDTDRIETVIDSIEQKVKEVIPYVKLEHIFVEVQQ
ncbi:MAG: cation diffusion facilitator family transporter [Nitrososphaera sp.]|nr:cation diffusion facilitator family transporter [Nitrososphaera sp.]